MMEYCALAATLPIGIGLERARNWIPEFKRRAR
jgi:hypothetical protein